MSELEGEEKYKASINQVLFAKSMDSSGNVISEIKWERQCFSIVTWHVLLIIGEAILFKNGAAFNGFVLHWIVETDALDFYSKPFQAVFATIYTFTILFTGFLGVIALIYYSIRLVLAKIFA